MKLLRLLSCCWIILAISCFRAHAQEMTGKDLARKVFDRDRGKNAVSTAQMVFVSKEGHQKVRQFTLKRFTENNLETQIIRFIAPADIEGTGFLTIEKPGWKTEQFLFLPALRRSRRIVTSQKSHRFVNSDFTYEDMERHSVDVYNYAITGSKTLDNQECHVLETTPKKETESQYNLVRSLISKQTLVPLKAEYFDKQGTHIKTYQVLKLEQVQGIWTESSVTMKDLTKGHTTHIKLENIIYNTDIDKDLISRKGLENY